MVVGRFSVIEGPKTDILNIGDVLDIKTLKYKDTVSSPFYPGDNLVFLLMIFIIYIRKGKIVMHTSY